MKRLRHDLNYLISAGLLVTATISALTGIVAHLWDLNDFWYHTYSSYVMTVFALAHVWLNWHRMVSYARFRFVRKPDAATLVRTAPAAPQVVQAPAEAAQPRNFVRNAGRLASRRGFLSLTVGGIAGFWVGRGLKPQPAIVQGQDVGVVYHQWSKPGVIDVLGTVANWGGQPPLFKAYPQAETIKLPAPDLASGLSTEEAIRRRRSVRSYSSEPMTLVELSRVLFLTCGINDRQWGNGLRTAPSSGALYPLEVYPVVHNVAGLSPGVYHYNIRDHALHVLRRGDMRGEVVRQGLGQQFLGECNVVLFYTVIFQRMRFKYQDRTYRYGLLEAGHLAQNTYLAATSMGLGACAVGAFMDDAINAMLGVDGTEEAAIYMLALGNV